MSKFNSGVILLTPEWARAVADPMTTTCVNGKLVAARPIAFQSLRERIRATWLVWTGKADALVWPQDQ